MAYDLLLANRVRDYLSLVPGLQVEEKKMFGGLAFLVNGKMCINVTGNNLMCRFDPTDLAELSKRKGFLPMEMQGKKLAGYCCVDPEGFDAAADFAFWLELCIGYNARAKSSKR